MKVGDLVKHWMFSNYGIGVVVEKEIRGYTMCYKVLWSAAGVGWDWVDDDKLEAVCK